MAQIKLAEYTFDNSVADCLPTITGLTTDQWSYSDTVDGNITTRIIGTNVEDFKITQYSFSSRTSLLTVEYLRIDENVTGMNSMFQSCSKLTSVNTSNWDTSGVKGMSNMFRDCHALTSLDVSNFNTNLVTNMGDMFRYCRALTSLDLSNFNTNLVTGMQYMFLSCSSLTSLDISHFNVKNLTAANGMFSGCSKLISLDLPSFNGGKVNNTASMFANCSSLTSLDLSNFDTGKVTTMQAMFSNCSSLTSLDLSSFDTGLVTNAGNMFDGWSKSQTVYVGTKWTINTSLFNATFLRIFLSNLAQYTFNNTVADCLPTITGLTTDQWAYSDAIDGDITTRLVGTDVKDFAITQISFTGKTSLLTVDYLRIDSNIASMFSMFQGCSALTLVNTSNWDTSKVNNMGLMFQGCSSLTSLDVSNFNTALVTSMSSMFGSCRALTSLDLSNFESTALTNMGSMFQGCGGLTSLSFPPNFKADKVTSMAYGFQGCGGLTSLDLSSFRPTSLTTISAMFQGCGSLTSLDLSSWGANKIGVVATAFQNCTSLETLDLSGLNTKALTHANSTFNNCQSLTTLDLSNWIIPTNVTDISSIFTDCKKLSVVGAVYNDTESVNRIATLINTYIKNSPITIYHGKDIDTNQLTTFSNITFKKYIPPTTVQLPPHIQLHSLPDGTRDELDLKTGILTRNVGCLVLDGNEDWIMNTTKEKTQVFRYASPIPIKETNAIVCNLFMNASETDEDDVEKIIMQNNGAIYIAIDKTKASSVPQLQEWLSSNNVKIHYKTTTPTTEQIILNKNNTCDYGRILPTGMCDKYDVVNSIYTQTMASILLDGANTWDAIQDLGNTLKFTATGTTVGVQNLDMKGAGGLYCDNNLFPNINDDSDVEHCRVDAQGNKFYIYISKDRLMSPDLIGYQIWLQTNKFNMTYELVEHLTYSKPYEELDPTQARWEGMDCVKNGAIRYHTNNSDNFTLYPTLEYIAPSSNSFKTNMLKPNTQYSVYANNTVEGQVLNLGGNPVEFANGTTFTSGTDDRITFDNAESLTEAMVIEGDVTNESVPYFTGMQSVKTPVLTTTGKNLIDFDNINDKNNLYITVGRIQVDTANKTINGLDNNYNDMQFYVYLEKGKTYRFSVNGSCNVIASVIEGIQYSSNSEKTIQTFNVDDSFVFEGETGTHSLHVTNFRGVVKEIQLEENSEKTFYEPFKSNILMVNEPIELRGIGDVKDELNLETGELIQRIGETSLDDSYSWEINEGFNGEKETHIVFQSGQTVNNYMYLQSNDNVKSSHFQPVSFGGNANKKGEWITLGSNKLIFIKIRKDRLTTPDVNGFKKWLSENPTTVQYQLAEPITRTVDSIWNLCQYEKFYQAVKTLPLNTLQAYTSSDSNPPVVDLECSTGSISDIEGEIENSETISFTNAVLTPSVNPINNVISSYGGTPTISTNGLAESTIGDGLDSSVFVQDGEMPSAKMKGETLYNIFTSKKYFWSYALNNNNASFDENGICSITQGSRRYEIVYASPSCASEIYTYRIWYDFSDFDFDKEGIDEATFYVGLTGKKADGSGDDRYIQALSSGYKGNSITIYRNGSKTGWWQFPTTIKTSNETKEFVVGLNHSSYGTTFNLKTGGVFKFGVMFIKGDVLTQPFGDFYDGGLHSIEEPTITTYNSNKTESTTTHLSDIVLRKIDTFQDELDLKTGILTRRVGEITLNGTENWKRYSTTAPICTLDITEYTRASWDVVNVVSNNCNITANTYRSAITYGGGSLVPKISMRDNIIGLNLNGLNIQASASSGEFAEADTKAWLQANPITIQYILLEEKTEQVDLSKITKPYAYTDGTIQLSSNGTIPTLEYQTLAANNMTANVKPNTTYTVFGEGANGQVLSICGTNVTLSSLPTVITSGSVANNTVTYSGNQAIKGLILHEGNYYDTAIKNPSLTIMGSKNFAPNSPIEATDTVNGVTFSSDGNTVSMQGTNTTYVGYDLANQYASESLVPHAVTTGVINYHKNKKIVGAGRYTLSANFTSQLEQQSANAISLCVIYDDNKMASIGINSITTADLLRQTTFTAEKHVNGIYLSIWYSGYDTSKISVKNIQLEKGGVVTEYEPHSSIKFSTNEEITLRAVGDLKDKLDLLTGNFIQYIGEIVFNGSENWTMSNNTDSGYRFSCRVSDMKNYGNSTKLTTIMSDKLPTIVFTQNKASGMAAYQNNVILYTEHTSVNDLKTWLSENPLTVQYHLAEPLTKAVVNITNQANEPIQFKAPACTGTEHIQLSSDNDILPTMHYAIPSKNSFYLPSIKTGTLYTLKYPLGSGTIQIGNISYNITSDSMLFTTPLNITGDKNIVIFPSDDNPQNVMLLEGSFRDREIEYFTGMKSVINPIITIRHSLTGSEQSYKLPNNITLRSLPNGVADTIDIVNGRLTQSVGYREYQDGDNELQGIYTDGYHTVYGLPTPTISNIVFPKPTINEYSIMKLSSDELIPQLTFRALSSNHFPLDLLEPNATYTLKAKVSKVGSFTLGGTYTNNLFGTTVIPLQDATNNSLIFDGDLGVSEVVLVKGDVSNLTVPYFSDILSVNNGTISVTGENGELNTLSLDDNGIVLRSCGTYTDTIDLTTSVLTIRTGEITFKGIENWTKTNDVGEYATFRVTLQGVRNSNRVGVVCNKFKHVYDGLTEECIYTLGNSINISVKKSTISGDTVDAFKLWLTRNNVTVVYPLSSAITIPLTNVWTTMPPTSYEKSTTITTVTQDISLKPLLNATVAITTLEQIAANLEAQNIDLQAQNESLEQENVATMLALTDLYETMVAPMAVMSLNSDPYAMSTMSLDDEEPATNVVGYTVSPMSMIYAKLVHRGLKTMHEVPYNLQIEVMYALKGME